MSLIPAQKILVVMPNWLGDAVMATPFLRALRSVYPAAHITALARPLILPVLAGLPFINDDHGYKKGDEAELAAWLRRQRFDLGILLPNSFRSAWLLARAGIPARLGYAREWRSLLLTHSLAPVKKSKQQRMRDALKQVAITHISRRRSPRVGSAYEPMPTIDYYLALAGFLGAKEMNRTMHLVVTGEEESVAAQFLRQHVVAADALLLTLIPGANFGASKCYPPERFAAIADHFIATRGATVLLAGAPSEKGIIEAIQSAAASPREKLLSLAHYSPEGGHAPGLPLGALKEIIRRSHVVLCNDTGPRHFAAAFNVPTVTLFGPTDPRWAETFHPRERQLHIDVPCGPCQLKVCPIDHRCLTGLSVQAVIEAIDAVAFAAR